ncbi:LysE family translocator [Acinetobacter cumulans]|uniref:LysE family translocator n=1 Tax=Acinetobacter cumulans TaxID=2136182 RepID=A0A3A8GI72_9GAMM|nr:MULTISPECIES: LysE family transporter [Acinetobacter]NWK74776.1 LysE family transporter [Acinetobacter sp. SwsAc6]RKG42850.1 LysE family translocator [Acinetobacter cumulans]RKG52673.1 LysE family translocator [Acinetobacter cumulans]RLL37997.1 LysE family translocator [Acinetobacter cumulans]RZG58842.1 LysE family translocator [Acinetobacter sp. WCHAc060006]
MISWFFMGWVITILLTPGPTNTLLASSGLQVGVKKSFRLIPAEAFGYLLSISFWGLLIGKVTAYIPALPPILKLFSAAYMLYLAIRLWKTANAVQDLDQPCIRAWELFLATLLNPKALLFASAIFPAIAWKNSMYYTAHMLAFLLLLIPIAFFWTFIGSMLASNKFRWLNQYTMQRTASVVLMGFTCQLSYLTLASL